MIGVTLCRQVLLNMSATEAVQHRASLDSRDNGSVIPDSPVYGTASLSGRVSRIINLPARERSVLHSVSEYLMKQTYIAMLIVMMVMPSLVLIHLCSNII